MWWWVSVSTIHVAVADRAYTFTDNQVVDIGRQPDSMVQISDSRVSRRHGELRWDGDSWVYRDLASSNGSFQAGVKITEIVITEPIDLRLGDGADGSSLHLEPEIDERTLPTFIERGPSHAVAARYRRARCSRAVRFTGAQRPDRDCS